MSEGPTSDRLALDDPNPARIVEAILFAAGAPLDEASLATRLPDGTDVGAVLEELRQTYANRGVTLVRADGKWYFRTAPDLAEFLRVEADVQRRLSRAAVETLAIIAYHQPVTRAEIEEIRGVGIGKGTLDILFEAGWVRPRGRRRTPGRPVTWVTTEGFLQQFGLEGLIDLPGMDELKAAGLLDRRPATYATGETVQGSLLPESIEQAGAAADAEADEEFFAGNLDDDPDDAPDAEPDEIAEPESDRS